MDNLLTHKQEILKLRARIVQAIRAFFVAADFLEVETPQRIPTNAPEVQIIPQESGDWQLQTSPELAMASARPLKSNEGHPNSSRTTSICCQLRPQRKPVPSAFT